MKGKTFFKSSFILLFKGGLALEVKSKVLKAKWSQLIFVFGNILVIARQTFVFRSKFCNSFENNICFSTISQMAFEIKPVWKRNLSKLLLKRVTFEIVLKPLSFESGILFLKKGGFSRNFEDRFSRKLKLVLK